MEKGSTGAVLLCVSVCDCVCVSEEGMVCCRRLERAGSVLCLHDR